MMDETLWSHPRSASDLGSFVAAVRRERGLTQAELAGLLGISRRSVYELEGGKSTQYVERLFGALRLLGVSLEARATPTADDRAEAPWDLGW
ncbi:MAG: helix-turn-helix domain-containing protein [Ornithinimicrobium sp.]